MESLQKTTHTGIECYQKLIKMHLDFVAELLMETKLNASVCPALLRETAHVCTQHITDNRSWSKSHDGGLINEMSLFCLRHWIFDEGIIGSGEEYEVLVFKPVNPDQNFPDLLCACVQNQKDSGRVGDALGHQGGFLWT